VTLDKRSKKKTWARRKSIWYYDCIL